MKTAHTTTRAEQIADTLRRRVASGQWKARQRIAADTELAKQFGVCRATMIKALKVVEGEGLLEAVQGKGRFVVDPQNPRIPRNSSSSSQGLRKKTSVLGYLTTVDFDPTHPVINAVLTGIRQGGQHLKLVAHNPAVEMASGEWPINVGEIDGLIVGGLEMPPGMVLEMARQVPVVWREHESMFPGVTGVGMDYAGGAFAAVRHVVELGHAHVGLVALTDLYYQGRTFYDGARLAVLREREAGTISLTYERCERNQRGHGLHAAQRLLAQADRPTAIVCGSDDLARGVLEAVRGAGLRVPEDVSVVGWNDFLTAAEAGVAMTSVGVDHQRIGEQTVETLLGLIANPGRVLPTQVVPVELRVRGSTAAPGRVGN